MLLILCALLPVPLVAACGEGEPTLEGFAARGWDALDGEPAP